MKITKSLKNIYELEELSNNNTVIHRAAPMVKVIFTVAVILMAATVNRYELLPLVLLLLFIIPVFFLSRTPFYPILARVLIALPFSAMAGISNIFFNREIALVFSNFQISFGMISFTSIILKTIIAVCSVLLLMATTRFDDIMKQMERLKVPRIILIQFLLTYRYINVLIEETINMIIAYKLRSGKKGIEISNMGSFVGHMLLKSISRADRIYTAMKCRGFDGAFSIKNEQMVSNDKN